MATTLGSDPGAVIIVDTVVGYSWMGLLLFMARQQRRVDRWTGADRSVVDQVSARLGEVLRPFSWAIILVTTVSLLLSLTSLARLEEAGASTLGYAGFYLLLASVGAQGDLRKVLGHPAFVLLGVLTIAVHAAVMLTAIRALRAPFFFFGAASQACTGGYSSAPIVAAVYQPGTATIGLLLAVVGNVIGTYAGLLVAQLLSGLAP